MIFETHAHYDDEAFNTDREELLASLPEKGIPYVINVGASIETTKSTIALMNQYDFIYGALGVHPSETAELTETDIKWLKEQCTTADTKNKCVAIGEIGLDYYWNEPERDVQQKWFVRQLQLAKEVQKPVIIHSRDAAQDTIDIMKAEHAEEIGGVVHCYSYSVETAKIFLDMGYYFGIGGVVTFSNGRKLKEVVEYLPMDRILLETDSPYLAPVPNRGKRNSSLNIPYVVEAISTIKGIAPQEVENITMQNARKLFGIFTNS